MLAWFYQGFIDDWLRKEVVRWRFRRLTPQGGRTLAFAWSNQSFFAPVVLGVACPHQGFSHRLRVDGTGVCRVSLTQLVAFSNCRTLSS